MSRGVRWDRIFLTTTVLLAVALALCLRWRKDSVTFRFDAALKGGSVEVRFLAPIGGRAFATEPPRVLATFSESRFRTELEPGHYLVNGYPLLVPPPADGRPTEISWVLPAQPPEGFSIVPVGAYLDGEQQRLEETTELFIVARHEVTREEFAAFLQDSPSSYRSEAEAIAWPEGGPPYGALAELELVEHPERARWPVGNVTWYAALAYAKWYTAKQGAAGRASWSFRLPTTKEWTKLALGTDGRSFPWGFEPNPDPRRGRIDASPEPVDSARERRSPYGVHHAFGNVSEWTADASDLAGLHRIVMGASYSSPADVVREARGHGMPAHQRLPEVGFRLVGSLVTR